jgi:predicted ATPase
VAQRSGDGTDAEDRRVAALNTGRLPVRLAPLVGRQRELQEVVDALARSRLVTLTGPGGTGKTRLALAAAEVARGRFPGGVCWVELAPIDDPAIAPQAVADGLGIPEVPGQDATMTIAEHVGDRPVLLVLDNCEHLAAAVAELADRLLRACASLSILTTSRELLGVDGEHSWPVPPLSGPGGGTARCRRRPHGPRTRLGCRCGTRAWPSGFRPRPGGSAAGWCAADPGAG